MADINVKDLFKDEIDALSHLVYDSESIIQSESWGKLKLREDKLGGELFDLDEATIDPFCFLFNKVRQFLNDRELEVAQLLNSKQFEEKLAMYNCPVSQPTAEEQLVEQLDLIGAKNSVQLLSELDLVCEKIDSEDGPEINSDDYPIISSINDLPEAMELDSELIEAQKLAMETLSMDIDLSSDELGLLGELKGFYDERDC